ncbi:MAG: UDP binding domain-containing protein, partial [Actinomycetes bacterium]
AFIGAEAVVLATEWKEYRELDPKTVSPKSKFIIDGRNVLDVALWQRAGFKVLALGRTITN